jgi:hypothetical protein
MDGISSQPVHSNPFPPYIVNSEATDFDVE